MGEEGAAGEDGHALQREELRGMWELPSVVHFAQTFRQQFKLRKFSPDVSRVYQRERHRLAQGELSPLSLRRRSGHNFADPLRVLRWGWATVCVFAGS